jgi:hypothetical protein
MSCRVLHISHEPSVWRYRFYMTTKSPTLNISVLLPSSVWGFENPGGNEVPLCFRCTVSLLHTLCNLAKISHKTLRHTLNWKIHGLFLTLREVKTKTIYECRCDERLKTKSEKSTLLSYTGFLGQLEHLFVHVYYESIKYFRCSNFYFFLWINPTLGGNF